MIILNSQKIDLFGNKNFERNVIYYNSISRKKLSNSFVNLNLIRYLSSKSISSNLKVEKDVAHGYKGYKSYRLNINLGASLPRLRRERC
jgi:hypothetical protein